MPPADTRLVHCRRERSARAGEMLRGYLGVATAGFVGLGIAMIVVVIPRLLEGGDDYVSFEGALMVWVGTLTPGGITTTVSVVALEMVNAGNGLRRIRAFQPDMVFFIAPDTARMFARSGARLRPVCGRGGCSGGRPRTRTLALQGNGGAAMAGPAARGLAVGPGFPGC